MDASTQPSEARIEEQARSVAPVVWLLGKVQSGKSSIVRALTGASRAEIGRGFKACTTTAEVFDFPTEAPLIRFLDTRGLSEAGYDPAEDIAVAEKSAHATIAVMRAMDGQQDAVFQVLHALRRRHPGWPIVVAQTHLHEGYAQGASHPDPYPFRYGAAAVPMDAGSDDERRVPSDLARALAHQRAVFAKLPGRGPLAFVPLDFTLDGDGYEPAHYGLLELQTTLAEVGPSALRAALEDAQRGGDGDGEQRDLHRLIVGYAAAASAADLIPLAAVAAVPAVQARLLSQIATSFGVEWNRRRTMELAGALGAGFAARYAAGFGIRQLAKLIPVYGQTAGAAAAAATSFATTYALGKAAAYYLASPQDGATDPASIQKVWAQSLREAFDLARLRGLDTDDRPTKGES
ncbi:MAG: GTPase domain-containing protein [Hyphomicrobiaceae bacterium]|nr:GTPase domain-containing protein [Hyphomicrobiaceae bacterium]